MVSYALFCPSRGEAYRLPAWLALSSVCAKEGGWRATVAAAALKKDVEMKKLIMMLATAFAAAMPLMAETETVGGYTWTYRINGDTAC